MCTWILRWHMQIFGYISACFITFVFIKFHFYVCDIRLFVFTQIQYSRK